MASSNIVLRWLLPASMAVNVFLSAALLVQPRMSHHFQPPPGTLVDELTRNLSDADAQILRQALAATLKDMDQARRLRETLPQRLHDLLLTEPFDKAAFKEELVVARRSEEAARSALDDALPDAFQKISQEGRRALAEHGLMHQPPPPPSGPRPPPPPSGFEPPPPPR